MIFTPTRIPDVVLIEPAVLTDDRGFFMEVYRAEVFAQAGIPDQFVQENQSGSRKGTLRGLHYQIRNAQDKLIRVTMGEVFDVAVDMRRSSPTFGQWVGEMLSAQNKRQLWIPKGFAHGFYVLSDWAEVAYKVTDYYAPAWDRTVLWNDSTIGIEWPLAIEHPLLISAKDARGATLGVADTFE